MLTGFHGFHVMVGTIFLLVCFFRLLSFHFIKPAHLGFEAAIWYWHFVDVIWIFLYFFVYLWPNFYFFTYHLTSHCCESSDIYYKYLPYVDGIDRFDFYFSFPNFLYEANFSKYNKYYKNLVIKETFLEYIENTKKFMKGHDKIFIQCQHIRWINNKYGDIIYLENLNYFNNSKFLIEKSVINFVNKMFDNDLVKIIGNKKNIEEINILGIIDQEKYNKIFF